MKDEVKELDKKIEELKQRKDELMLEQGEAFRCKDCNDVVQKSKYSKESNSEGLCYTCWEKEVKIRKRNELMQTFKEAKIIDIVPDNNPFADINKVEQIILEAGGKRYEVIASGYDEVYIEILELKEEEEI